MTDATYDPAALATALHAAFAARPGLSLRAAAVEAAVALTTMHRALHATPTVRPINRRRLHAWLAKQHERAAA